MSTVTLVSSNEYAFEIVTAMLLVQNKIMIAAKQANGIFERMFYNCYSLFQFNVDFQPIKMFGNYKNIPDMAMVEASSFAFIDQGSWTSSDIHLVELKTNNGKSNWRNSYLFSTDASCCGISVTDGHYFLTFSGIISSGYVKMLDSKGTVKHVFNENPHGVPLFSRSLSKIYVDPEFRMYVSNIGNKQLLIIKVTSIGWRATVDAEYDNIVANSIIRKGKQELFVAIGGWKNEVMLHSAHGPKKIVRQNEISGTPTALCLVGEHLYVATNHGWPISQTSILVYKDNKQIRKDEHVISM